MIAGKRTAADGPGAAIGEDPGPKLPWKIDQFVLASPFRSWSLATRQKTRRSGSKSGSGRWSHWDEIGWVHYPEIGWSHSDEIRWVQSPEILQDKHSNLERPKAGG